MILLLSALLAAPAPPPVREDACPGQAGVPVHVKINGLADRKGRLKLDLYPANEADFLKPGPELVKAGKVYRRVMAAPPQSGPVSMCIAVPAPGRYALVFTHDRNGKGESFSIFSDGAAYVGSAKMGRGEPKLAQTIVTVPAGGTTVTMQVQYLRGIGGFAP